MASNPNFPKELSYGYLKFEGNGKIPYGQTFILTLHCTGLLIDLGNLVSTYRIGGKPKWISN